MEFTQGGRNEYITHKGINMKDEKISDTWQTPKALFTDLNNEFNFDIDLCAHKDNAKCNIYCTDYLANKYNQLSEPFSESGSLVFNSEEDATKYGLQAYYRKNVTCFMNPPYSNPKPFIQKAWDDSKHCKIVCLVKCDPSTKWWATFWLYNVKQYVYMDSSGEIYKSFVETDDMYITSHNYNGPKPGCTVRFFSTRIKFEPPNKLNLKVVGNKYKIKCDDFNSIGSSKNSFLDRSPCTGQNCLRCKGAGFRWANLAGASFPCAIVIMDRRGLE